MLSVTKLWSVFDEGAKADDERARLCEEELGEVAHRPLAVADRASCTCYVPGCDDVHHEVDRNGTGGMFLRSTQK